MAFENLQAKLQLDASDFKQEAEEAADAAEDVEESTSSLGDKMSNLGGRMKDAGKKMTLGLTTSIGAVGVKSLQMASDVEEMEGKMGQVFGDAEDDVVEWANTTADEFNRSTFQMQDLATSFQDTFVPLGFAREEATGMSKDMAELTQDLASFNNMDADEAARKLESALVGNHSAVRDFGVILTQERLDEKLQEMYDTGIDGATEQQKAQARMNLIMQDTADAHGDAARTADSFANQVRGLKAQISEAAVLIGKDLLPVVTPLINHLKGAVERFTNLDESMRRNIIIIGALAAAAGPLLLAFGTFLTVLPVMATGFATLTAAVGPLAPLFAGLIGVVGALAAAFAADFANIRGAVMNVVTTIRNEFGQVFAQAKALVTTILGDITDAFGGFSTDVEGRLAAFVGTIEDRLIGGVRRARQRVQAHLQRLTVFWMAHGDEVIATVQQTYQRARERVGQAVGRIRDVVEQAVGRAEQVWDDHGPAVVQRVQTAYDRVREMVGQAVDRVRERVNEAVGRVEQVWADHGGQVKDTLRDLAQTIVENPIKAIRTLIARINPILGLVVGAFYRNWQLIKDTTNAVFGDLIDTVVLILQTLHQEIVQPLQETESEFRTTFGEIRTEVAESMAMIRDIIDQVLNVILNGFIRPYIEEITGVFQEHFGGEGNIVQEVREAFIVIWQNIIRPTLNLIQAFWEQWGDEILTIVEFVFNVVVTLAATQLDLLLTIVQVVLNLIQGDWEGAWEEIEGFLGRTLDRILGLAREWGPQLAAIALAALELVGEKFIAFGAFLIDEFFPQLWDTVLSLAQEFGPKFVQWAIDALNLVLEKFIEFGSFLVNDLFPELWATVLTLAQEFGPKFVQWAIDALNLVLEKFIEFGSFLVNDLFPELWDTLTTLAEDFGSDFETWAIDTLNAVLDLFNEFKDLLVGDGGIIPSLISDAMEKFNNWKDDLVGNDGVIPNLKDEAVEIITNLKDDLVGDGGEVPNLVSEFGALIFGLKEDVVGGDGWLETMKSEAISIVGDMASGMASALKGGWNAVVPESISSPSIDLGLPRTLTEATDKVPDDGVIGPVSVDLPQFQSGGFVREDTLAMLHAGEFVLPESRVKGRQPAPGGAPQPVVIDAPDDALIRVGDLNSLMRQTFDDKWDEKRRRLR